MSKVKKEIPRNPDKKLILPLTKGSIFFDPPGPGPVDRPVEIGKPLKDSIVSDVSIPIQLANKKIVDYFTISTANPVIENKGALQVNCFGRELYSAEGIEDLSYDSSVSLYLSHMNLKPAFIQVMVSDEHFIFNTAYWVNLYSNNLTLGTMTFPSNETKYNSPAKKHYLSFFIDQQDTNSPGRYITVKRSQGLWSFFKIKVFILQTQL